MPEVLAAQIAHCGCWWFLWSCLAFSMS